MSNSLAVAATTATLRNLLQTQIPALDSHLHDLDVTTQPLDLARKNVTKPQLNLFLYQTAINGGWRNLDIPSQIRPGERGAPPLPLNLHYLITAYGRGDSDNDVVSHRVLGGAMSVLHDNPILDRAAITAALAKNDLGAQFESLRITMLPTSVDELSKLWMIFQSQYRISAAYEVTVVLIDSLTPVRSGLPVLQRGQGDSGVVTRAGSLANLTGIVMPHSQSAARLGEDIVIRGKQLTTQNAKLRFTTQRLPVSVELVPQPGDKPGTLVVHIPGTPDDIGVLTHWAAGQYTVALVQRTPGLPDLVSNEISFSLAPQITVQPHAAAAGTVNLTITAEPRIVDGQRILLLFGERQIAPTSVTTPADPSNSTTLQFTVPNVAAGAYVVRLRVDGVDSIPVSYSGTPPTPSFDTAQKVVVT